MNAVELLRRLHQHRAWVNGNLLTAAAGLTDEQLRSPFQFGQGSVWKCAATRTGGSSTSP